MISTIMVVFTFLSLLLAIIDLLYGYQAFRKTEEIGRYLGMAAIAAAVVNVSYLLSLWAGSYRAMSVASSVYFAGIDWMLVALIHFVYRFTGTHMIRSAGLVRQCIRFYALFDTAVMAVNIFREIAVHYVSHPGAPYSYQMKPLYVMHLCFTYLLVGLTLFVLFSKSARTPRQYRNQYLLNGAAIILVVLINAVFLYPEIDSIFTQIDYSILGYSLGVYLMFWAAFDYRQNDMLKSLSMTIFQNIDQGIVLFDYSGTYIMHNRRAEQLLPEVRFTENMDSQRFLEHCTVPAELSGKDQFSVQCERDGGQGVPLRCDFSRLRDHRGNVTGNLFVFTDATYSTDLLTGFRHWEEFRRYAAENPYPFSLPSAVVVFDIVGLGEVNRTFGREVGDQRIRSLAKTMRKHLPEDASFIRGYEAHLIAVCLGETEEALREKAERIAEESAGTVLCGTSSTVDRTDPSVRDFENSESRTVIQAIEQASRAVQVKKLLNSRSLRSQTLTSLVRALQESDSDTEAHVRRTQKMGDALGRRVGLTDAQLADLRLLCLLHDIGKIGIPLEILNKPGKLTDPEWEVLRSHAEKGYQIAMSSDELKSIARMILYHHERWDGKGYPERLAGNSIPVLSRVIAIVDAYDAMVNDRAYRSAMSPEEAQQEIRRCAGTQFDPYLAEEFLLLLEENPAIARGRKTGGGEIRVFRPRTVLAGETGNTAPIPFSRYILDLDDNIIEVDDRFEEITGYARGDAVGRLSQYDLIPKEDRAYYIVQVNEQFARGSIAYLRHELQRRDGSRIWVVCCGKRYFDSVEKAFRSEVLIYEQAKTQEMEALGLG